MLRHLFGIAFVVIAALMLSVWTSDSFVQAAPAKKKDPNAVRVKAAQKDLRRVAKAASKAIRADAKATVREIKRITKIIRTGKGVDSLVAPSKDGGGRGGVGAATTLSGFNGLNVRTYQHFALQLTVVEEANGQALASQSVRAAINESAPELIVGRVLYDYSKVLNDACSDSASAVASAWGDYSAACYPIATVDVTFCGLPKAPLVTRGIGNWTVDFPLYTATYTDDTQAVCTAVSSYNSADGTCDYAVSCVDESGATVLRSDCVVDGNVCVAGGALDDPCGFVGDTCEFQFECTSCTPARGPACTQVNVATAFPVRCVSASGCDDDSDLCSTVSEVQLGLGCSSAPSPVVIGLPTGVVNDATPGQGTGSIPVGHIEMTGLATTRCNETTRTVLPSTVLALDRFPSGPGANGFTIRPDRAASDPGGEVLLISVVYAEDIPLNESEDHFQYGFVFDQDGNGSNNYQTNASFPLDFFQNTDKWYEVIYSPMSGWSLRVRDVRGGGGIDVSSAAGVVINGNTITLVVPRGEVPAAPLAGRVSAYRHDGAFSLQPPFDYSADYFPFPTDPLHPFFVFP